MMYLFFLYKNIFYKIIGADILLKRTQLILCSKICELSTIHVFYLTVYHGYVKKLTSFLRWKRKYVWQQILANVELVFTLRHRRHAGGW